MTDVKRLTKDWIQYLKNNQIVAMNSDSSTGKLSYKKKVTTTNLIQFLEVKSDYDDDAIESAINSVLSKKSGNRGVSTEVTPTSKSQTSSPNSQSQNTLDTRRQSAPSFAQQPQLPAPEQKPIPPKKKYSTDDAEDIDFRDSPRTSNSPTPQLPPPQSKRSGGKVSGITSQTPDALRKRSARSVGGKAFTQMQKHLTNRKGEKLKEDFTDSARELSEKDVEDVFSILQTSTSSPQNANAAEPAQSTTSPSPKQNNENPEDTAAKIDKLKDLILNKMTEQQRKYLWNAINKSSVTESRIDKDEVSSIFRNAYSIQGNSYSVKSSTRTKLNKDKLEIADLQQAWKEAGYPSDTSDLEHILSEFGFGSSEIDKIFTQVLGSSYGGDVESTESNTNTAIDNIIEYITKNGMQDEIKSFMKQNFSAELDPPKKQGMFSKIFGRKAVAEEIREIFTSILTQERTTRNKLIQEQNIQLLGRRKK